MKNVNQHLTTGDSLLTAYEEGINAFESGNVINPYPLHSAHWQSFAQGVKDARAHYFEELIEKESSYANYRLVIATVFAVFIAGLALSLLIWR